MRRLKVIFLLCAAMIMASGCVSRYIRISDMETDSMGGDTEYSSVVYWDLNVRDRAIGAQDVVPAFSISWYDKDENEYENLFTGDAWAASPRIGLGQSLREKLITKTIKEETTIISGPVFKKAKPGKYRIDKISLIWDYRVSSWRYIDVFLDREFTIPANSAVYLGSFNVDIVKTKQGSQYESGYTIRQDENEMRASYKTFASKYPNLAAQFQNNVFPASFTAREPRKYPITAIDENFADNARGWILSKDGNSIAGFESGMFVVDKADDESVFSDTIKTNLPAIYESSTYKADCGIELTSVWQSGREERAFGLLVGSSAPDYFFAVNRQGEAAVYEIIGGKNYSLVLPWKNIHALQGAKEFHQTVEVSPESSAYFVNGEYVGRVRTRVVSSWTGYQIGFAVSGKQKVSFKRLTVSGKEQ